MRVSGPWAAPLVRTRIYDRIRKVGGVVHLYLGSGELILSRDPLQGRELIGVYDENVRARDLANDIFHPEFDFEFTTDQPEVHVSNIAVEEGVVIPEVKTKYPWAEMQVGSSFLVPVGEGEDARVVANRIRSLTTHRAKRTGLRYSVRKVEGGMRVWRVA